MNPFVSLMAGMILLGVQETKPRPQDKLFLETLKSADLVELLEVRCLRGIEMSDLPEEPLANSIIFLSDRLNFEGLRAGNREQRDQFWKRSDRIAEAYVKARGPNQRVPLIKYQQTGCWLRRAQLLNDQAKLAPDDKTFAADAMAWAQKSANLSEELTKQLQAEDSRRKKKGAVGPNDLNPDQIYSLARASSFRQAASLNVVANLTADNDKQLEIIAQADRILGTFLRDINVNPLTLEALLARAEVQRLRGETSKAEASFKRVMTMKDCPPAYVEAARLAWARMLIQVDRDADAINLIEKADAQKLANPDLAIVYFEALIVRYARQALSDGKAAEKTLQTAMEVMDELSVQGNFWKRRCQNLLIGRLKASGEVKHAGLAVQLAELHRRQNEPKEALAMYDRAAELSQTSNKPNEAKEIRLLAANFTFELGDYGKAISRLEKYAADYHEDQSMPRASILLARAYLRQNSKAKDPKYLEKAKETLEAHLRKYRRDAEITPQVDWLLAQLYERSGNTKGALEHYLAVPEDHTAYLECLEAIAGIYHRQAESERNETPAKRKSQLKYFADDLERRLKSVPVQERPIAQERALAIVRIALAELWSEVELARYEDAIKLLADNVLTLPEGVLPRALVNRAWLSHLRAATRAGKSDVANVAASHVEDDRLFLLFGLFAEFAPQGELLTADQRVAQCTVINATAERMLAKEGLLDNSERLNVQLLLAESLAARGDLKRAEPMLKQLRKENPRDPRVLESLARAHFANKQYAESRAIWSALLRGYRRGEPQWFQALHEVARCQLVEGNPKKTLELINTTEGLFPDLGGPKMKPRFDALKADARKAQSK